MNERLEQRVKKQIIRKTPSNEIMQEVQKGNKFILVEREFNQAFIPQGYTLIDMKYKGDSFKTLVPQSLLFYMANPGEDDSDSALEELADFYGDIEDFEEEMIENGDTSPQEANWGTIARESYSTYLINKLVKHKLGESDEDGDSVPEFDEKTLKELDLNDDYVAQRVRAIAALSLGKSQDEIKKMEVKDLLKHVTIFQRKTREVTDAQELEQVRCYAGSHYELKEEYCNKKGRTGDIRENNSDKSEYSINGHSGEVTKTFNVDKKISVFNSRVYELESDIQKYREQKHKEKLGRHDSALIRQYANLAYIIKENPQAQLDIKPSAKLNLKNIRSEGEKK